MTELSASNRRLLQLLSPSDIERIHGDSLTILEKIGVSVQNNEAVLSLKNAGCTVSSNRVVLIPRSLAAECLKKTASVLKLYGRNGKHERPIGNDSVLFNPGSSAVYISDHRTGQMRQPLSEDLVDLVRLVDGLGNIQAQSTAMVPSEVPSEISDLYRLYLVLRNSTKGVITGAFTKKGVVNMKQLLEVVAGGEERLVDKPMAVFDVCPSSPLGWSDTACQNLID